MKIAVVGGTGKEGSGMALRWAKAHDTTDGDMGDALLTMAFLVLMIVNWGCLEFTAAYRWLNGGGA